MDKFPKVIKINVDLEKNLALENVFLFIDYLEFNHQQEIHFLLIKHLGHVIKQTCSRAVQTLCRAFGFLLRLQKLGRVFQRLLKTNIRPSILSKKFSDNLVCKKHRIFIEI